MINIKKSKIAASGPTPFFKPPSNTGDLQKLLDHISLGELTQGEEIWRKNPCLLTEKGRIKHDNIINGQAIPFNENPGFYEYNHTAYQILLMNEEFEAAKAMHEHMAPEEIIKQFDEIFPNGVIRNVHIDLLEGKELLANLLELLKNDQSLSDHLPKMSPSTEAALHALYSYAKPSHEHEQGLVFDCNLYLAARQLYEKTLVDQAGYLLEIDHQRLWVAGIWCVRVEEWLAGCLGTAHLRRHAKGLTHDDYTNSGITLFMPEGSSYYFFQGSNTEKSILGRDAYVGNGEEVLTLKGWGMYHRLRSNYPPQHLFDKEYEAFFAEKNQEREAFSALIANLRQRVTNKP